MAQATVAIGYILYEYGGSRSGLIMHLTILYVLLIVCLLPFSLKFINAIPFLIRRVALALILSIFNCLLLFFYALTIIGYHSWCGPITLELILTYIGQLDVLLSIYGLSVSVAVMFIALMWVLTFGVYYYSSKSLLNTLSEVESDTKQPHFPWRVSALYLIGLLVIVYALTYQSWTLREPLHIAWLNVQGFLRQAPPDLFLKQKSTTVDNKAAFIEPIKIIRPRPLILITVDSLRSDQMGLYGASVDNTPFLSGLWRKGQLHRLDTAYSICTTSACGMVGTLSSKYWHQLNKPPVNLADVLKEYGYKVSFLLSGDNANFFGLRKIFGSNIDLFYDGSDQKQKYVNDDRTILNRLRNFNWQSANHIFLYMHLMSVHAIGFHEPRFEKWLPTKEWSYFKLSRTPRSYRNNYYNGILQADNIIEEVFRILEEQGILENALVIITADHGEYLGEMDRFGHGYKPYEPMVRIPLLVYDRLQSDYPPRSISSQVDVAPTMLYAIGVAIPTDWSGIPLQLSTSRNSVYVASYGISGVVEDFNGHRFKYLRNRKDGKEELFDLSDTESESFNLAAKPETKQLITIMRGLNNLTNNVH
jgi:glucan phosphoethanolaminetransferase (alkaline phosphatase superfamily)